MSAQWINFGLLNTGFLILFAWAEYLYQKRKWAVEHTRKLVHITAGLMALSFPFAFDHWLPVAMTTGGFAGLLFITKRKGWLNAINGIQRQSHGSYLYPLTLISTFVCANYLQHELYYLMPVMLMAVGDPMACLVGKKAPLINFKVPGGNKSFGGMIGCFVSSFILAFLLLQLFPMDMVYSPFYAGIILALTATVAEAISGYGMDNITIPVSLMTALYFMQSPIIIV